MYRLDRVASFRERQESQEQRASPVYLRLVQCRLAKVSCGYATLTVVAQTYM